MTLCALMKGGDQMSNAQCPKTRMGSYFNSHMFPKKKKRKRGEGSGDFGIV